jgi:hypothetical protein
MTPLLDGIGGQSYYGQQNKLAGLTGSSKARVFLFYLKKKEDTSLEIL